MQQYRYLMYLRKSSESEERQELSIPAQARELRALAARQRLILAGRPFEESMSAKEPGRPVFNLVIDQVCAGKADGVLCWKLDRLARNPLDGGRIMHSLGKGQIKAIVTPDRTFTGTGDDKLLMSIIFGMATKYSDDLSDNVKRGNREALRNGRWPGKPKLGYKRDHETMRLVPDPERFPVVQKLWRLLVSGTRPLETLRLARQELNLMTPVTGKVGGRHLSKSGLYRMFRDPFYAGIMIRKRESFPGTHPPMVTMDEFRIAQTLLDGKLRPTAKPKGLFFTYRGLLVCGRCGACVTARNSINRYGKKYIYYHCCRKERRYGYCPERAVQEKEIQEAVCGFLDRLTPPEQWTKTLLEHLVRLQARDHQEEEQTRYLIERLIKQTDRQLDKARDLLIKETITEEEYQRDRLKLLEERQRLTEQCDKAGRAQELVEPHKVALGLLNQAKKLFCHGTPEEKRDILEALTWNLKLKDKKVLIEAKKPFSYLGEWSRFPVLSG